MSGNPDANPSTLDVAATRTTGAIFQTTSSELYVPVVTLSVKDNMTFLENRRQGFKRIISWSKYRSEIATQPKSRKRIYFFIVNEDMNDIIRIIKSLED